MTESTLAITFADLRKAVAHYLGLGLDDTAMRPESTAAISFDDIREAIAHFQGIGTDDSKWSDEDETMLDMALKRGLRQFYNPPKIYKDKPPHQWSFLKPYSTGTIALVNGDATVTLTGGTWPAWAATHGLLVVSGVEYAITSRTSDSEIELAAVWAGASNATATYSLVMSLFDTTKDYPYCNRTHAETLLASCLAAAELQENDTRGERWKHFEDMLTASIEADYTAYINNEGIVDDIIKRGLRQFYFPPVASEIPHQWNFLKPTCTIDTIAPYSTGTIAIVLGGTTVTLTTGVWPSWTATHGTLVVDNTEYAIASRTDDTHIELETAWAEDTETAAEFVLNHDGNYDLPDDFGGIEGDMVCESSRQSDITIIGEGKLRSLRRTNTSQACPTYAAVRPKEHTATTVGQRFEIMFYPIPGAVYTLSYKKRILPQMLVNTTIEYPYGGTSHAETILASCLAVAEEQENDKEGTKKALFQERLTASIALDRRFASADYFGYNGDGSDSVHQEDYRSRRDNRGFTVNYQGG